MLLWGLFARSSLATDVARYLAIWPLGEIVALVFAPYLMLVTASDGKGPAWQRAMWLPLMMIVMVGVSRTLRLFRAIWVYMLAAVPVAFARHTTDEARAGCARSYLSILLLVLLMGIFGDRARVWPIGTLAGRWMAPDVREAANMMALGVAYFGLALAAEVTLRRMAARGAFRPQGT